MLTFDGSRRPRQRTISFRESEAAWDFYIGVVDAFEGRSYSDVEITDADDDKVLIHQKHDMRGRASGAPVGFDCWVVITFRDGKVVREAWFVDRAAAYAAAGLSE